MIVKHSVNACGSRDSTAAGGYADAMTLPNHDLSSVADPGSMDTGSMTEPDNGNPGDLDHDHQHLADDSRAGAPAGATDSPAAKGSPLGPPD